MKINKKTVSHFLGLAVLFGAVELTNQLTKTEEQVTYSVTLESLALGNGETDGENGGGGTDGETGGGGSTGGGATTRNGYDDIIITRISQKEVKDVNRCLFKTRTRNGLHTTCKGQGTLPCTPGLSAFTPWSSWILKIKDEEGCQ